MARSGWSGSTLCRSGGLRHEAERISGQVYGHALSCDARDSDSGWAEFDLRRDYERFRTTVGQADRSEATTRTIRFSVIGDGETLYTTTVGFGQAVDVDVDVTGVLRLRLDIGVIENSGTSAGTWAVWGDPTVGG